MKMKEARRLGIRTSRTPEARKAIRDNVIASSAALAANVCSECAMAHCFWCGRPFTNGIPPTRDHWRPIQNEPRQTIPACLGCNSTRGDDDSWVPWHKSLGNVLLAASQLAYEIKKDFE